MYATNITTTALKYQQLHSFSKSDWAFLLHCMYIFVMCVFKNESLWNPVYLQNGTVGKHDWMFHKLNKNFSD